MREREGPIAKRWEGEGKPTMRSAAQFYEFFYKLPQSRSEEYQSVESGELRVTSGQVRVHNQGQTVIQCLRVAPRK